ncbi:hypothetical protein [Pseudohoeflea coraliihabitans]|uniref:ATP-grasp domain-containing protein n=1 Tax=Pseudohoeflea coraliihabitans TaxID=2860393 RepID=A0ABS6WPL8_9HYPH|nr:hypothetical protein [Pseudohoeflea sp. DP4N28-3]MBW3097019.1 hypothetical protein [Pseudohoeflea sp. DP4N28-3]
MITFIACYRHLYTFRALRGRVLGPMMPATRAISYERFFASRGLRPGTYVFTDFERMHPAEVRLASHIERFYRDRPGFRFLNVPARVRIRLGLLRSLKEHGLNSFDAYPAESHPRPRRFPVFIRLSADHAGPIGGLIADQDALEQRLAELERSGVPLTGLLVVEYCADRLDDGLFEKFSVYRIGDRYTLAGLLVGQDWDVKSPDMDFVDDEIMQRHLTIMREDHVSTAVRKAFELAGIDYGRADLGYGDGQVQVYEINTNPSIKAGTRYISEAHRESREIFRKRFAAMLHAVDLPGGAMVPLKLGRLDGPSRDRLRLATARRPLPAPLAWVARLRRPF